MAPSAKSSLVQCIHTVLLVGLAWANRYKKVLLRLMSRVFSFRNLVALGLTFSFLIYFECIFVCGVRKGSSSILLQVAAQFSHQRLLRDSFLPCSFYDSLSLTLFSFLRMSSMPILSPPVASRLLVFTTVAGFVFFFKSRHLWHFNDLVLLVFFLVGVPCDSGTWMPVSSARLWRFQLLFLKFSDPVSPLLLEPIQCEC